MRVAFSSSDGVRVDQHFGAAPTFSVWEVDEAGVRFVEQVGIDLEGEDAEDRILARVERLQGCTLVYTQAIGGPAAAKLVARRVQPLRVTGDETIAALLARLHELLQGAPPPWLARALGRDRVAATRRTLSAMED
jgi:nitrogen fixation protein NifX